MLLLLEGHSCGIHVADNITHVPDHSREEKDTNKERTSRENVFLKV